MTFDQVATFVIVLLALAGGINVVGGAIKVVQGWLQPVADNSERMDAMQKHLDNDNRRLNELEESNRLVLRGLNVLIEHETTGNHTAELEQVQADITSYLINR